MRSGDEATILDIYLRGQRDVMILAMNSQNPMNTYIALARQRQLAGEMVRREEGLGIPCTFQNLPMHTSIAFIIACIPAPHVDHYLSAYLASDVQPKRSLLDLKRSAYGVQRGTQAEFNFARGSI
jgi:hypothetical protein